MPPGTPSLRIRGIKEHLNSDSARKVESEGDAVALECGRLALVREDHVLRGRPWAEAGLAGEKRVLQMIAGGESLPSILDALCLAVEEVCRGSLCSILLLDAKGDRLWQGAAPSLPRSCVEALDGREIASCWGPCGAAAFHKEQVIASDIQGDPLWNRCRELVLSHGLRACWSTPIFSSEGRVLGTMAILSPQPCSPTPEDQEIIREFTHLASIAIERTRSEEALQTSEAYLAEAQKLSHTGSFGWNVATGKLVWSAETFCILGYEPALTPTLEMVLNRVHPNDLPLVQQVIDAASHGGAGLDFGHRVVMPDGSVKHLHVIAHPARSRPGEVEFVGAVMDVTERKRAEALAAGEKRLLEMIARGVALAPLLDALCRFGEEMAGDVLVSILLVSSDGKSLRHGAAPSLPRSYAEAIDGGLIGPHAGSCGAAAYMGKPVIVSDIATDPLWDEYRDLALQHGLRACWSTPIISTAHEVMGTFGLYSRKSGVPTSEHRNLIEQMSYLAAVAIERKRAEEALRQSESRFEGILRIAEDAIISVDSSQRILLFNQGAEKVFGYAASEVVGKPLDLLLPQRFAQAHRGHVEEFARSPEVSRTIAQRREVFGRRKDGREFPAEASISKLQLGEDVVYTAILRDVTERKEAAEALRVSAQLARGQTEALTRTLDALAKESAPDRLVEHVLRTLICQLGAHSSGVWLRDEGISRVTFEFAFEGGRLLTKSEAALAKISPTVKIEEVPPWPEVFRTGKPGVLEDIREGPAFPWREHVLSLGVISILIVPMLIAGRVKGVTSIRFTRKRSFRTEEIELAQALAHQAMLVIQLVRLSRQSRRAAVAAERNRLARDIHDMLAQGFTGVIVHLEAVEEALSQRLTAKAEEHVIRAAELAREGLQEARRSVQALRPRALEEKDLCEALKGLIQRMTEGTGVQANFLVRGEPRELALEWEENLLRIGQEVLTNALRHAQASEFNAQIAFDDREIRLHLRDNGRGFDTAGRHDGFGLQGMRERVEGMGGHLSIQSRRGEGTTIGIVLPLANTLHPAEP
ncbi:MAG: GAF domain-containing protein [Limisphaerales bacterium]